MHKYSISCTKLLLIAANKIHLLVYITTFPPKFTQRVNTELYLLRHTIIALLLCMIKWQQYLIFHDTWAHYQLIEFLIRQWHSQFTSDKTGSARWRKNFVVGNTYFSPNHATAILENNTFVFLDIPGAKLIW